MPSAREADAEKCKKVLKEWARRPENRTCADCGIKQPQWASTNIGVCVCINCSGVHRNMGVHISFVKSLTLDGWTSKLTKSFMSQGGNKKINACYEANMPKSVKPTDPTNMRALETFIRSKYQKRTWYSSKGKKKRSRKKRDADGSSDEESSSDSSSDEPVVTKKKSKGKSRVRKSKRPRPALATSISKKDPTKKKKQLNPPPVVEPADVPDLLDFAQMKVTSSTDEVVAGDNNPDGFLFGDFSPKANTSPPSLLPGMSDQPPPTAMGQDPFQQPAPGPQSATDKVMNLFKKTAQPQNMHNANIYTQISQPNPGSGRGRGNFQPRPGFGFNQPPPQQRPGFGFNQPPPQQQRPGFGFNQQQRAPQMSFGQPQQRPAFGQPTGFGQQQQQRPPSMGFGHQQQGFNQGFQGFSQQAPPQQQNAFSGFGQPQRPAANMGSAQSGFNLF